MWTALVEEETRGNMGSPCLQRRLGSNHGPRVRRCPSLFLENEIGEIEERGECQVNQAMLRRRQVSSPYGWRTGNLGWPQDIHGGISTKSTEEYKKLPLKMLEMKPRLMGFNLNHDAYLDVIH